MITNAGQETKSKRRRLTTPEPTDAPAGSLAKIEVLRDRLERGERLWHPDDRNDQAGLSSVFLKRFGVELPEEYKVRTAASKQDPEPCKTDSKADVEAARRRLEDSGRVKRAKVERVNKPSPLSTFMSRRRATEPVASTTPVEPEPLAALSLPAPDTARELDPTLLALFHSIRDLVAKGTISRSTLSDFLVANREFIPLAKDHKWS